MTGLPTCRTGGFIARRYDDEGGVAYCPACGWMLRHAADLGGDQAGFARVPPHKSLPGVLVMDRDRGGPRHFLDGKPVHCGEQLQIQWWTGALRAWLPCRYELDQVGAGRAVLYVTLPGRENREVSACILYTRDLAIRWPIDHTDVVRRYRDELACPSCGSRRTDCGCSSTPRPSMPRGQTVKEASAEANTDKGAATP